jgi:hypothetical protein
MEFAYRSASRIADSQILADLLHQQVIHFGMPWDGGTTVCSPIAPPRMVSTLPDQLAIVFAKMLDESAALHTETSSSV